VLISIVTPAYNEEKLIGACLESVRSAFAGLGEEQPYEHIVCDNASTDGTAAAARAAGVKVVFEPLRQIAAARNTGAAAAAGELILFVDADSRLSAATLRAVLALMAGGETVGGGSIIRFDPAPPWWGAPVVTAWNLISRVFKLAAGSFIFCRADAFHGVGGFDRRLYAGEELALSTDLKRWGRARGLGFRILTSAPHVSSSRKFEIYGFLDLVGFVLKFLAGPLKTMKDPGRLPVFYNCRR